MYELLVAAAFLVTAAIDWWLVRRGDIRMAFLVTAFFVTVVALTRVFHLG